MVAGGFGDADPALTLGTARCGGDESGMSGFRCFDIVPSVRRPRVPRESRSTEQTASTAKVRLPPGAVKGRTSVNVFCATHAHSWRPIRAVGRSRAVSGRRIGISIALRRAPRRERWGPRGGLPVQWVVVAGTGVRRRHGGAGRTPARARTGARSQQALNHAAPRVPRRGPLRAGRLDARLRVHSRGCGAHDRESDRSPRAR